MAVFLVKISNHAKNKLALHTGNGILFKEEEKST